MKKLLSLALGIAFLYSCSSSSDGNGNANTTVVPLAPTALNGIVQSSTQINLNWTDNSTNETGFKIERKTGSGTYTVIGTTATDVTTFNDAGLTPNTVYIYRVYANNAVGNSLTYSNEITLNTLSALAITTATVNSISATTAVSGGIISSDGGISISARGVCWSTSPHPTVSLSTKTINGYGIGDFSSNVIGLSGNTTYYIRAYATNIVGTTYGNEIYFTTLSNSIAGPIVTDIDGNNYQSVTNCNQTWTKNNLNVSKYTDGTPIPQVTDPNQWKNLTTGAWCYYNNDPANGPVYGKIYNWFALEGIYDAASLGNPALRKKLIPTGWHVPSNDEWSIFTGCLGGSSIAGGKMKEIGTEHWLSPNVGATNDSGFTGLPGGFRDSNGIFHSIGDNCYWFSSNLLFTLSTSYVWYRNLTTNDSTINENALYGTRVGYSVRCVKD